MHHWLRSTARVSVVTAMAAALAAPLAAQTFVNFEDLAPSTGGGAPIPTPYQGRTWALNSNPMGWISPGAPYTDIVCRSGTNCGYNGFGLISGITGGTPFTFSGWLRRWNWTGNTGSATTVLVEALNGATVVGSTTLTTTASYQFFQLLTPMTSLRFTPQGGSGLGCAQGSQNCGYFLLDDITFNPAAEPGVVPEPSTYVLMLTGLAAMVVARKRRRNV